MIGDYFEDVETLSILHSSLLHISVTSMSFDEDNQTAIDTNRPTSSFSECIVPGQLISLLENVYSVNVNNPSWSRPMSPVTVHQNPHETNF